MNTKPKRTGGKNTERWMTRIQFDMILHHSSGCNLSSFRMPYGVNQYLCIYTLTEQKFLDTYITLGSLRKRCLNNTWCLTYTSTVHILFDISESLMGKFRILSWFRCHAGNTSWPLLYCTYLNILLQSTAMTETYHYLWLYEAHRDSRSIEAFGIYSSESVNQILWGCVWDVCTLQFQARSGLYHVLSK